MALGNNLETAKKRKVTTAVSKEAKSTNRMTITSDIMIKDLDQAIFEKLPMEAKTKIKELYLKNNVLNESCLISMTDKKGIITYVNDKFCEVAKYTREELIGQNQNIVRHPSMPKSLFKELWATIGKGEMFIGQITNRAKDGAAYMVDAYIAPILDDKGKPEAYVGIRYDITELLDAKSEINALRQAIDTGWASIEFHPDGTILSANQNFIDALGYEKNDDVAGKHHSIFCEKEYAHSSEYKNFWGSLANGVSQSGEFKRISKQGKEVWINASYNPIKNDKGEIIKVIKIATDITAMVKAREKGEHLQNAINQGWAWIEFSPEGVILSANDNFVKTLGYESKEAIVGQHHRIFCEETYANSVEYKNFWKNLANGSTQSGEFMRITKDDRQVWINASYTPVKDENDNVVKVIKIASDITDMVALRAVGENMQAAVDTGWASIEFQPDGTILSANKNFVTTLGYENETEIIGKHHRIFCEDGYAKSNEYSKFWNDLAEGHTQSGEYKRITKQRDEVWINASYAPVKDTHGHVVKVIKIASDITEMINARQQANAVNAAVDTGWASIEFKPDGTILTANDNFVSTLGYSDQSEMVGNHHSMFCDDKYAKSSEYANFWKNLANGITQAGEFERVRKDGKTVWIQASYAPIKDEHGIVYKVIKIAADISNVKFPVLKVSEIVKSMAEGDLTKVYDMEAEGYIAEMGDALNVAIKNLNGLLGDIDSNSNLLAASSEQMFTKSDQMKGTTQEVASAIGQMAEGVQQQAQQIDESSSLIEKVNNSSTEMASKSNTINKAAETGQTNVKEGLQTVKKVVESMTDIQDSAKVTSQSIAVLTERSEEIARTLNVITDIAAQTNLLALNAAIEAARAGDAGRGFAVVAEEIRKLAEDSRTSAGDIEKVISAVAKDITSAGKAISDMDDSVKEGNTAANQAQDVFKQIDRSTADTLELSKDVLKASKDQKLNIEETVKNIEKIVVVSEQTAAGTEEIATSSKDLDNGMDEFNSTSKSLAEIAMQLQQGVSKFTLKSRY